MSRNEKITVFLKDCIADALLELMKKKPIEKITIDEISKTAGIGRATYFRHFSSKQAVLTYKIVRSWETQAAQRNMKERKKFDIANAQDFFEINYSQQDVLSLIYAAGLQSTIFDAFKEIMIPPYQNDDSHKYTGCFYAYGLYGLLDEWIVNGFDRSPQEMKEILLSIFNRISYKPQTGKNNKSFRT